MDQQMQMTTDAARAQQLQAEADRAEALRLADVQRADEGRSQEQQDAKSQHSDAQLDAKAEATDAARDDQAQSADAKQLDEKRRDDEQRVDETRRDDEKRRDKERDDEKRRDEAKRSDARPESAQAHEQDAKGRDADKRHEEKRQDDKRHDEKLEHAPTAAAPSASAGLGASAAPASFADAAAQSRAANDAAVGQQRVNERYQQRQEHLEQRINGSHSPAEREKLTAERDLAKHEHLGAQKARLLSHDAAVRDPETRERLTNEVKEHHKEAQELRTKLHPENNAYQRVEQRGEAAELKSAQAGVHAASPATVRKVEELEQRHEKVKEQVATKERAPERAHEDKRELEK